VSILEGEPVRIPKVSVVVAGQLRRSIIRGEFRPGDPLPNETELMELYDVSRPVVREALRIIESESLISVKRGAKGGARVQRPDIVVAARHTALLLQIDGATVDVLDHQPRTKRVTSGSSPSWRLQWPWTAASKLTPAGRVSSE